MAEVFRCDNCGARMPPPAQHVKMIVCEFCKNPRLNPFYVEPPAGAAVAHAVAPIAHAVAPQAPAPQAPAPQATAPRAAVARTPEEILRVAHGHLQLFDSLFYAPTIPPKKEQGARGAYGAMIPADEPLLVLYDATVFGGADDGFVVTPKRLGWKNIALDPRVVPWELFDASTVQATEEAVQVMGDEIQIGSEDALQPRLVAFLRAMGAAQAPAAQAPAARAPAPAARPSADASGAQPRGGSAKTAAFAAVSKAAASRARVEEPAEEETEEEEEGYDAETVAQWIEDTRTMAEDAFRRRASLHIAPKVPSDKERIARRTHADALEDDDTIVVLYDPVGGGNDDGFAATPWGIFWKNRGEDPSFAWWTDIEEVALDDGVLTIDGWEVRVADVDRGLADELYAFIEAMVEWASEEEEG